MCAINDFNDLITIQVMGASSSPLFLFPERISLRFSVPTHVSSIELGAGLPVGHFGQQKLYPFHNDPELFIELLLDPSVLKGVHFLRAHGASVWSSNLCNHEILLSELK